MKQKRKVKRGDIYYADLPKDTVGSQQAGRCPVLITQNNYMNERAPTVLVAAITSVIKRLDLMTHVLLPKESMVMTEQRYTLDKQCLRHTFATRGIEAGVPPLVLKKWLGHTNIHITLDTYSDMFDKMNFESTDKLDLLMGSLMPE